MTVALRSIVADGRPAAGDIGPRVAVIIPAYRHPVLLAEAVQSVLRQRAPFEIAAVIVDDGCPLPETSAVTLSLARADGRVRLLQQPNEGLSAARNLGIEHVLAAMPTVEALYFLDADNRISPTTLATSLALLDPAAGVGWVYPHIDRFGIPGSSNHGGPYSRLLHIAYDNICEAGSLVARTLFGQGLRFDETMRLGCEDWEFWLQCIEAGYRGRVNPVAGFEYRRRPESMVSVTRKEIAQVRGQLRERHPALHRYRQLVAIEHEEAPRFLVLDPATGGGAAFTDPALPHRQLSRNEIAAAVSASDHEPETHVVPDTLIWLARPTLDALVACGLAWSMLNSVETLITTNDLVLLRMDRSGGELGLAVSAADGDWQEMEADGLAASHSRIRADGSATVLRAKIAVLTVKAPLPEEACDLAPIRPVDVMSDFRRDTGRPGAAPRWCWREPHFPAARERSTLIARHLGMAFPMPRVPRGGRTQVGLAVTSLPSGPASPCRGIAAALREAGYDVHLLVFGASAIQPDEGQAPPFASVGIFPNGLAAAAPELAERILGFLAGLDVVINFDVAPLHAVAARLRGQGMRYVSHIDRFERTSFGRPCGHAALTASYEHVQDLVLTGSSEMSGALHAAGVPLDKLLVLPPAFLDRSEEHVASGPPVDRGARRDARLSAAAFGPPDRRTLERLPALVARSRARSLPVDWHYIVTDGGQGAVDVASIEKLRQLGVRVHRLPVLPGPRQRLWRSMNVVLVPGGCDGGGPLATEAEAAGCVGLDTGAAQEEATLDALAALATDGPRRESLARLAAAKAGAKSWQASCEPLVAQLRAWFADGALH